MTETTELPCPRCLKRECNDPDCEIIDAPKNKEPDYKSLLLSLLASLTMCDHMGDVCGDVQSVMDKMGVKCDVDLSDSKEFRRVLHGLGAKTLYGSEIWDEED